MTGSAAAASPPPPPPNHNNNSTTNNNRPSDRRRQALNQELSVPLVSNFFPIERYYDAADKVYASFLQAAAAAAAASKSHHEQQQQHSTKIDESALDDAYVYGKRYCMFCVEAIPEHNYYNAAKYKALQVKHNKQVDLVLRKLQIVAQVMDEQEVEKERLLEQKRQEVALREERQRQKQYQDLQRRIQRQKEQKHSVSSSSSNVEASALSKLKLLQQQGQDGDNRTIKQDPSGEEPGVPSSRYRYIAGEFSSSEDEQELLPPPVLPPPPLSSAAVQPPPPPSYDQILSQQPHRRNFLGPAAMIGPYNKNEEEEVLPLPLPPPPPLPLDVPKPPQPPPVVVEPKKPLSVLRELYKQDYIRLQHAGRIQVTGIPTYQGRISASTNGCTVISALVAARHLRKNPHDPHGSNITNSEIVHVIDAQCGPLLKQIRSKLGLDSHALIIPSDVHDHLVDCKILYQDDFEGAAGGNILDASHMGAFLQLLSIGGCDNNNNKQPQVLHKGAATLFFREHVISIVKIVLAQPQQKVVYDLVDSLPGLVNGGRSMATRTRCHDLEALQVLLRWYASRKFSDSNCTYIDRNPWDDAMADFDPRVFQGFVWHCNNK